jgi:hypothetical protein
MTPTQRQMHAETLHVAISLMFANTLTDWRKLAHRMSVEHAIYNRSDSRLVRYKSRPATHKEIMKSSLLVLEF